MAAGSSYLSSDKYGYDFVIATTQASINSGLWEYLQQGPSQPVQYLCFSPDDFGSPSVFIDLNDLEKDTGVNPFQLPLDIAPGDERLKKLYDYDFRLAIKIQVGAPPGMNPKSLPPIVTLGNGVNNVDFIMYIRELTIYQIASKKGVLSLVVTAQPRGQAWYIAADVDIQLSALDKTLNTPYYNDKSHKKEKEDLLEQLSRVQSSGFAYSLQQLLFDLNSATLSKELTVYNTDDMSTPKLSDAVRLLIESAVLSGYKTVAEAAGHPILAVLAVKEDLREDPSQLHLTGFQRQVNKFKGSDGLDKPNPTFEEANASTLDYLCVANGHKFPGTSNFNWNWMDLNNVNQDSGIVSINRNIIADFVMHQILSVCSDTCLIPKCSVDAHALGTVNYSLTGTHFGGTPQTATITDSGENTVHIAYFGGDFASDSAGATRGELRVEANYTCDITFKGPTMVVVQHLDIPIYAQWDSTGDGCKAVNRTISDTYALSVGLQGQLNVTWEKDLHEIIMDEPGEPSSSTFVNLFVKIKDLVDGFKAYVTQLTAHTFDAIPIGNLQSFVFPGGKVFTFNNPRFSSYQDLICDIVYASTDTAPAMLAAHPALIQTSKKRQDLTLAYSSDLMQNYIQGETVAPTAKFQALQTANGHALLFAIDSSSILHVLEEKSGASKTGWEMKDLSSSRVRSAFPNTVAAVRTFDVGQSAVNDTISLAMAVSSGGSDNLFVSLSNSSSDTSWISGPAWVAYPFDAASISPPILSIENILFAETEDKEQYLIVDINRSLSPSIKHIVRYYIDPSASTGRHWVQHDVPVDIETGTYQSCVGRKPNGFIDGVYTSGRVAGTSQLVYLPIINIFGDGPPSVTRLSLPGNAVPSAIAASRIVDPSSALWGATDLYAVSGSTVYRFSADRQGDGAIGKPIVTNSFIAGTNTLAAMTHDGVTTLWGKNGSDEVYYISCQTSQLANPGSWSAPFPVISGVERISTFINKQDGGNTIFASGGGKLRRLMQSTDTAAKIWHAQDIKLAVPAGQKSLPFKSYTTTIQVTDSNNGPVANAELTISAKTRTPVYINGLYYLLGPAAGKVKTDSSGSMTIIEATEDLNSAELIVSADGGGGSINITPMDKAFAKLATLSSNALLRNAHFPSKTTAGGILGPTENTQLVGSSTSDKDISAVAGAMGTLSSVYATVNDTAFVRTEEADRRIVPMTLFAASPSGLGTDIALAAGDLFRLLKSGAKAVVNVVRNGLTDAWELLATIGNEVYRAVLDTVDAVVGAVEWVFNAIKTGINDLIRYAEFLFEWDDIRRTKDVMHNLVRSYLDDQLNGIQSARIAFDRQVGAVEQTVAQWAGIKDWSPIGDVAEKPAPGSASNPAEGQTSGSQLLSGHFRDNVKDLTVVGQEPTFNVVQNLIDDLLSAIAQEGEVLSAVYNQLRQLATDFSSLSVGELIKRVAGIGFISLRYQPPRYKSTHTNCFGHLERHRHPRHLVS